MEAFTALKRCAKMYHICVGSKAAQALHPFECKIVAYIVVTALVIPLPSYKFVFVGLVYK